MELATGSIDDFSQGVIRQEDPPLRDQPNRKCKRQPRPTQLDQGMRDLTPEDRQRLLRQASAAYKTAHREQQEAGIHVFTPSESPHFETNEEVPLDPKVFHYACHRLQFTPDLPRGMSSPKGESNREQWARKSPAAR